MRVFFASDLHYDKSRGRASARRLAEFVVTEGVADDILILGGDYANDDATVTSCLELFDAFAGRKAAIAGNHDIWVGEDAAAAQSMSRYRGLSDLFADAGVHPLEDEPLVFGNVALVGAMGWYDYSLRDPMLDVPMEVYRGKSTPRANGPVWNDALYAKWGMTDPEVTDWQLERITAQLEQVKDAESIIVALHHVPTKKLLRPSILPAFLPRRQVVPKKWLVLNTYLGSSRFEDLLADYADRIDSVFCGHIHLARRARTRDLRFASNGSSYREKELLVWADGHLTRRSF
jgi:3',5'-cyclic AMP phosphodiesterase CpdA